MKEKFNNTRTSLKGAQSEVRRSVPTAYVTNADRNFRGYNKTIILPSPVDNCFCSNGHGHCRINLSRQEQVLRKHSLKYVVLYLLLMLLVLVMVVALTRSKLDQLHQTPAYDVMDTDTVGDIQQDMNKS